MSTQSILTSWSWTASSSCLPACCCFLSHLVWRSWTDRPGAYMINTKLSFSRPGACVEVLGWQVVTEPLLALRCVFCYVNQQPSNVLSRHKCTIWTPSLLAYQTRRDCLQVLQDEPAGLQCCGAALWLHISNRQVPAGDTTHILLLLCIPRPSATKSTRSMAGPEAGADEGHILSCVSVMMQGEGTTC